MLMTMLVLMPMIVAAALCEQAVRMAAPIMQNFVHYDVYDKSTHCCY